MKISEKNTTVLYYDCTNYFFEIENGGGIPLAFSMFDGNNNEQPILKPLEHRILSDFELSKFVVCTDARLASNANRLFNDKNNRAFIVTQSLKKLKEHLKEWALCLICLLNKPSGCMMYLETIL